MVDIARIKRIIIISDQVNSIQRIIIMPITSHTVEQLGIVTTPHGRNRFSTSGDERMAMKETFAVAIEKRVNGLVCVYG